MPNNEKPLPRANRQIQAEPLTYTIYYGYNKRNEIVQHYANRLQADCALEAGMIARYGSAEISAADFQARFNS